MKSNNKPLSLIPYGFDELIDYVIEEVEIGTGKFNGHYIANKVQALYYFNLGNSLSRKLETEQVGNIATGLLKHVGKFDIFTDDYPKNHNEIKNCFQNIFRLSSEYLDKWQMYNDLFKNNK